MALILLIEDDKIIRENTQELLSMNGYNCITATNGREGLKMAMDDNPDLILCDIMLPFLNGYEIKNELNKMSNKTALPLIYMTAKASREEQRIGMDLGAADYITKPFKIDELLNSIKRRLFETYERNEEVKLRVVDAVCDFVDIAKHECNTPLNAIINFSELIKDSLDDLSNIDEMATNINISGKRLHKTLNNMINLKGLQYNKEHTSRRHNDMDLNELVLSLANRQASMHKRNTDMVYNAEKIQSSKFSPENCAVLFTELFDNAFKFSKPGDSVTIALKPNSKNTLIICTVTNRLWSPIDFTPNDIGPSKQLNRERNEQQGAGLGLYLCKLICERYGGRLYFNTDDPSVFSISLILTI